MYTNIMVGGHIRPGPLEILYLGLKLYFLLWPTGLHKIILYFGMLNADIRNRLIKIVLNYFTLFSAFFETSFIFFQIFFMVYIIKIFILFKI